MKSYFWVAETSNERNSGVIVADNAQLAHHLISKKLSENPWKIWVIVKLELIE